MSDYIFPNLGNNYIEKLKSYENEFKTSFGRLLARQLLDNYEFNVSGHTFGNMFNNLEAFLSTTTGTNFANLIDKNEFDINKLKPSQQLQIKEEMIEMQKRSNEDVKILEPEEIDSEEMKEYLIEHLKSVNAENDFGSLFTKFEVKPQLNAYYILGLSVYLENYVVSIFDYVVENAIKEHRIGLAKGYTDRNNAHLTLVKLFNSNDKFLQVKFDLLNSENFRKEFLKFMESLNKVRIVVAHREPKLKKDIIEEHFPDLAKISKGELSKQKIKLFENVDTADEVSKDLTEKLTVTFQNLINDSNSSNLIRLITDKLISYLAKFDIFIETACPEIIDQC